MKNRKFIWSTGIFILLFAFVFTSVAAISPARVEKSVTELAVAKYKAAQANVDLSNEEKIKTAIDAYFTTRYEGQKLLEAQDFSPILDDNSETWVKKEKDKREIELNIASLFDLSYVKYAYTLDYDSIDLKNNKAIVQLRESHEVVFKALDPDPSNLFNLQHIITLHQKHDGWVIVRDEYQDELSQLMNDEPKEEILKRVSDNYENEKKQKASQGFNNKIVASPYLSIPDYVTHGGGKLLKPSLAGVWHAYNRTAAAQYANAWASNTQTLRNPAWGNFDPPNGGGDCTNYVSQVIYAGAPQMDNAGSWQWYYYGYNDRSPSWTDVNSLYSYLVSNTWTGPYGAEITNGCALRGGDVIQLQSGSTWFHSLSVVAVLANCTNIGPGTAVRYNAHYTDRYQYPLSYVSAYTKRLIQIQGWRD
jgi:hypothetical protein